MHRKSQTKRSATLAVSFKKRELDCSLMPPTIQAQQKNENQNDNSTPKEFD